MLLSNDNFLAVLCKRKKGFWETLTGRLMRLPEDRRKAYIQKLCLSGKIKKRHNP